MILFQENTLSVIASILFLAVSSFFVITVPPFQKDKKMFVLFSFFFALWRFAFHHRHREARQTRANG